MSCPFKFPSWDLILEKICMVVDGEGQSFFGYHLNCAMKHISNVCEFKR